MPPDKKHINEEGSLIRFSLHQRIQHIILLSSMIILALTGLTLKFHENTVAQFIIKIEGGIAARGIIHRIAAVVLMLLSTYHIINILFTQKGHSEFLALRPQFKDFSDFYKTIKFNLGISNEKAEFDRFDFRQKIQYWGVLIGSLIMIITGFILWFETQSMAIMPKWIIDVTGIIHSYQGFLIFLILFLWHMYNVHLNPNVFPMNKTWLTGRISTRDLKENHLLEYKKLISEGIINSEEGK